MTTSKKTVLLLIALLLAASIAMADKKQKLEGAADLHFTVVRDSNGKPVRNATVILHSVNEKGRQDKGGIQSKTTAEGKVLFPGMPYGKIRVQVIAPGLQTFGEDYDINQPTHEIVIKLKPPQKQYSIYEEHPGEKKPDVPVEKK